MNFSALYAKTCRIPKQDAVQILIKYGHLLKWKNYKENILDVGCGEGSVTRDVLFPFLGNRVKILEAIDRLGPMIEFAKSVNNKKEIDFKTIDINNKEYIASNENKFDHIFSFYCIQWIVDTRSLLNTFYKILKPDGQIFMSTVRDAPIHRVIKKHMTQGEWSKYLPKKDYFANYTGNPEKYIRNILENTGFEVNLCKYEGIINGIVDNFKDFSRSATYMSEVLDYIPSNLREKYIDDHVKDVVDDCAHLENSKKYRVTYEPIIFIATKKT